jgi:hypothetical protein
MGDQSKIEGGTAVKETVPVAQATNDEAVLPERVQEALGELVGAAKEGLLALSVGVGLGVLTEMMEEEVDEVVGPRGKHNSERTAVRHGHEDGEVTLGGRRVEVERPRARSADGESEVKLQSYEHFADRDPLARVVLERMVAGVSTRRYRRTQERVGEGVAVRARSTSKSAVSRTFVERTRTALAELMSRQLADLRLAVMMIDGIELKGADDDRRPGDHDRGRQDPARAVGRVDRERDRRHGVAVGSGRAWAGSRAGNAVRDRRVEGALNAVANFEFERLIDRIRGPWRRNRP